MLPNAIVQAAALDAAAGYLQKTLNARRSGARTLSVRRQIPKVLHILNAVAAQLRAAEPCSPKITPPVDASNPNGRAETDLE